MSTKNLLDPVALARLSTLSLKARYVVEGFMSGLHQSPVKGFSQEFAQHREYVQGDDLRHIDWKVFGRQDKYFVKQYREETNLRCHILLDSSASMGFKSGGELSKLEYGSLLAASLAYIITKHGDSAGLSIFADELNSNLPPSSERAHLKEIVEILDKTKPEGKSGFTAALSKFGQSLSKKGIIVLISDLLGDPEEVINALKHLRYKKNEVIVFQVLSRAELELPFRGSFKFEDMETLDQVFTLPEEIREDYQKEVSNYLDRYKVGFRKSDIDYCFAATDMSFDVMLGSYLSKRN